MRGPNRRTNPLNLDPKNSHCFARTAVRASRATAQPASHPPSLPSHAPSTAMPSFHAISVCTQPPPQPRLRASRHTRPPKRKQPANYATIHQPCPPRQGSFLTFFTTPLARQTHATPPTSAPDHMPTPYIPDTPSQPPARHIIPTRHGHRPLVPAASHSYHHHASTLGHHHQAPHRQQREPHLIARRLDPRGPSPPSPSQPDQIVGAIPVMRPSDDDLTTR